MTQRRYAFGNDRETSNQQSEGLALAIARTVMVCGLRKPQTIGYEMLPIGTLLKTGFAMIALSSALNFPLVSWIVGNRIARGDDWSLRLFALAFMGLGLWLRYERKREKWNPNRPHRLDPGKSWFTFLPIREDYVYRFVDPGVAFLIGALLRARLDCPLLGLWCMIASAALAMVEWGLYQRIEQHDWQLGDNPKEAARDADVMKAMAKDKPDATPRAAIPTGMDANLAADIKRRQEERKGEASHELA